MQLIQSPDMLMLRTWEHDSDSRTQVVLLRDATDAASAVTLLIKKPYSDESSSLLMTAAEAAQLGSEVSKLIPDGSASRSLSRDYDARKQLATHRVDVQSGLRVLVTDTCQGEPYEDGIRIEISTEDYDGVISLEFGYFAAGKFAAGLAAKA